MGIGRNEREGGIRQPNPCELYPLSVSDNSRDSLWFRPADLEAPNQLRDYSPQTGIQVSMQDVGVTPPKSALWWTFTAAPREVVRTVEEEQAVEALGSSSVEAGLQSTAIQVVVRFRGEEIYVDIGAGVQFSVLSSEVSANLWIPAGADGGVQNVPRRSQGRSGERPSILAPAGAAIFDSAIAMNFTASSAPVGRVGPVTCTRTYDRTAGDTDIPETPGGPTPPNGWFQIPSRAKRVQFAVRDTDESPSTGIGAIFRSDIVSQFDRGAVQQWNVGDRERTSPWVDIPANASVVDLTEITGFVTAVWELDL